MTDRLSDSFDNLASVTGLIGRFSDDMTLLQNRSFGGEWASNEDTLALLEIVLQGGATTRRIAETSGLYRRAVSRLIARLSHDDLIQVGPALADRRLVAVTLSPRGMQAAATYRADLDQFFRSSHALARAIVSGLGGQHLVSISETGPDPLLLLQRIVRAGVSLVDAMQERAGRKQLSGRQRAALVQISAADGVRPNKLSPSLGIGRSGVAYVVDQLCDKGLVTRLPGAVPDDKRAVLLHATPHGRDIAHLVEDAIRENRSALIQVFGDVADWRADVPVAQSASGSRAS